MEILNTFIIYSFVISMCFLLDATYQFKRFKINHGLVLRSGTSVRNDIRVSMTQCVSLCELIDTCYVILWHEQSK